MWPAANEAAKAILATMMLDADAAQRAVEVLSPDDFLAATDTGETMAGVFQAIASLLNRGKRPAPVTVANEMKRLGVTPKRVDGSTWEMAPFLAEMSRTYTAGVAVEEYLRILRTHGTRRRLRMAGHKLIDLSANDSIDDPLEYAAQAEAVVSEATAKVEAGGTIKRMGDVILEQLRLYRELKPGSFTGLRTGFADVDDLLRGMQPADQIIIAARPSMGKTAFAQNIADYVAEQGETVLLISAEMPAELLALRAIASEGSVNSGMMRAGLIEKHRYDEAEAVMKRKGLLDAHYFVDDESTTVPQIRANAHKIRREFGLSLIIIDYLQRLRGIGPAGRTGNKVQEVSEISWGIKQLARELRIPIISLSQLSRDVEKRDDKRPMLSDLRDSGAVEQDADVVGFLYRENYYNPSCGHNRTEFNLGKNRNGPLGMVELEFIPERTKFVSIDKRHG